MVTQPVPCPRILGVYGVNSTGAVFFLSNEPLIAHLGGTDDQEFLQGLLNAVYEALPTPKPKKKELTASCISLSTASQILTG